jgi:hypothetical protein
MNKDFYLEILHGFNAGFGQSIIAHPLDTYKTWLQMKHNEKLTIKGLYRGFSYPAISASIVSGFAFKAYQIGKESDTKYGLLIGGLYAGCITGILLSYIEYKKISLQLNTNNKFNFVSITTMLLRETPACLFYYPVYDILNKNYKINNMLAGGIAGVTCWVSSYWADVLNTHVMTGQKLSCVIKQLKFKDYFRGLSVAIPRAFLTNSIGYFFYEQSRKNLN